MRYRTIYADPPWNTERGGGKIKRGADRHYPLMRPSDLLALPVGAVADDDVLLFLWATVASLPLALELAAGLGLRIRHQPRVGQAVAWPRAVAASATRTPAAVPTRARRCATACPALAQRHLRPTRRPLAQAARVSPVGGSHRPSPAA